MTWIVTAIGPTATALLGGAALGAYGSSKQASAAKDASQLQYQATQDAAKQQREMFDILNQQQAPYRQAGTEALTNIKDMLPYFTNQVTAEDLRSMPGFEFGMEQGVGATKQGLNVGGGGSNVARGATKFATDYATNVGLPAYINQRTGIYNTLADIAKIGQGATGQTSNLGQNISNNLGQLTVGGASALGSGQVGAANAMAGGYGNIGNNLMLSQLLKQPTGTSLGSMGYQSPSAPNIDYMGGGQGLQIRT
jgi:hypothetical protein